MMTFVSPDISIRSVPFIHSFLFFFLWLYFLAACWIGNDRGSSALFSLSHWPAKSHTLSSNDTVGVHPE